MEEAWSVGGGQVDGHLGESVVVWPNQRGMRHSWLKIDDVRGYAEWVLVVIRGPCWCTAWSIADCLGWTKPTVSAATQPSALLCEVVSAERGNDTNHSY